MQLGLQSTWKGTPDEVQLAQERSNLLIALFLGQNPCDCNEPCPDKNVGLDCEDDDMACNHLVFENGILYCNCCGTLTPIPGQTGAGAQPGGGAQQPKPGGGIATYPGCLSGDGQWYVPTLVNSGDQISVNELNGAWNDPNADLATWRGPQGEVFVLGQYVPGDTEFIGTDPLNTAPHMTLLAVINGVYYDLANAGPITVPPGISNMPVFLQANDSALGNDLGQVCFNLTVTNNQGAPWSHDFDFTVAAYPSDWEIINDSNFVGPTGAYVPGTGYQSTQNGRVPGAPVTQVRIVRLRTPFGVSFDSLTIYFAWTAGTQDPTVEGDSYNLNDYNTSTIDSIPYNVTPVSPRVLGAGAAPHGLEITFIPGSDATSSDPGGVATITRVTITGHGIDPF